MPFSLEAAQALVTSAHGRAHELGAAVTVAVVDAGGHLLALGRMDGAPPFSARIAETKAATAALFGRDGADLGRMQASSPAFFAQLEQATGRPVLIGAGTVLIRATDGVTGALSVSGGFTPGQDDDCADAALTALAGQR